MSHNDWGQPSLVDVDSDSDDLLVMSDNPIAKAQDHDTLLDDFIEPIAQDEHTIEPDNVGINSQSLPYPGTNTSVKNGSNSFLGATIPDRIGNEQFVERRFTGGDTIDEPIMVTLLRDVRKIGDRLMAVVWPRRLLEYYQPAGLEENIERSLREWDLWGPLVFCLLFSCFLAIMAPTNQSSLVFSGVFTTIWLGMAVATLNIQLLGGTISFFHALSIVGYSLFPLVFAAVTSLLISWISVRLVLSTIFTAWGMYSATFALKTSGVLQSRVFLALYPVGLLFFSLGWMCVIT